MVFDASANANRLALNDFLYAGSKFGQKSYNEDNVQTKGIQKVS